MLHSKTFISTQSLLCFSLCLHAAEDIVVGHTCFSGLEFPTNGSYEVSLNVLLQKLRIQNPNVGYRTSDQHTGQNHEVIYGLTQCWMTISRKDCENCISAASKELRIRCPHSQGAIIWYDDCLLKYSNKRFFMKKDNTNKIYVLNNIFVDGDSLLFDKKVSELLALLCYKAYHDYRSYGHGSLKLDISSNYVALYGVAQCTEDLRHKDCKKCLSVAQKELLENSHKRIGGRAYYGSCYLRFEIHRFY